MDNEIYQYQLDILKKNPSFILEIEGEITDEMKWIVVNQNSVFIKDLDLTDEMLNKAVSLGNNILNRMSVDASKIKEESIIEGISTLDSSILVSEFARFVLTKCELTEDIAVALCKANVLYYTNEEVRNKIIHEDKKEIITNSFIKNLSKGKNRFQLPAALPITEEQWKYLYDNNLLEKNIISNRCNIPEYVKLAYIDEDEDNIRDIVCSLTSDDIIHYIEKYYLTGNSSPYTIEYLECADMETVFRKYGQFIKEFKKPKSSWCMAAIECDPYNIQYIKKPSDKMRIKAVSLNEKVADVLDKKTEAVCKVLKEEFKDLYPEKNYLVKFDEDLCDESNIIKVCIIEGKDMEKFMEQDYTVSFGNLDDDRPRTVKDYATFTPITDEEIKTLRKFGLDNLMSGYFSLED